MDRKSTVYGPSSLVHRQKNMPPIDPRFWTEVFLQTLTLFVLIVGLVGLIVPVFPGLVVMWLATLLYALIESAAGHMAWIDWTLFGLITALMLFGNIVDNIIIARKMRGHSIPWSSIGISYLAGILASIFLTPVIGLAASPLALFGVEYIRLRRPKPAFNSAKTYMIGWGWSFVARFTIGLVMIGLWMSWAWL